MSQDTNALLVLGAENCVPWRAAEAHEFMMLVLYARPPDYPDHHALRAWYLGGEQQHASRAALLFTDERDAREFVRRAFPGLVYMGADEDDPRVIGVWL